MKVCIIPDCEKPGTSGWGWCTKHYKRWETHGDPNTLLQADCKGKLCNYEDCPKPARKQLLCNSHYTKKWRLDNPDLARKNKRLSWYNRYNRKRNLEGSHTEKEWEELQEQYLGLCAYCETREGNTKDHVTPISRGGTDYVDNILPACRPCNTSKSNKTPEQWVRGVA